MKYVKRGDQFKLHVNTLYMQKIRKRANSLKENDYTRHKLYKIVGKLAVKFKVSVKLNRTTYYKPFRSLSQP